MVSVDATTTWKVIRTKMTRIDVCDDGSGHRIHLDDGGHEGSMGEARNPQGQRLYTNTPTYEVKKMTMNENDDAKNDDDDDENDNGNDYDDDDENENDDVDDEDETREGVIGDVV